MIRGALIFIYIKKSGYDFMEWGIAYFAYRPNTHE